MLCVLNLARSSLEKVDLLYYSYTITEQPYEL